MTSQKLGVNLARSLDELVSAALENGALGAKMSGGGLVRLCHCSCRKKVGGLSALLRKGPLTWIESL